MLCSVHIKPPDVYNDIRIASLLRNSRNSANLFPCSVIMIYELLHCFAILAILQICFPVVYNDIRIAALLRNFRNSQCLFPCSIYNDIRIAALLRNFRNSPHIRNPRIFLSEKLLLPHVGAEHQNTSFFLQAEKTVFCVPCISL